MGATGNRSIAAQLNEVRADVRSQAIELEKEDAAITELYNTLKANTDIKFSQTSEELVGKLKDSEQAFSARATELSRLIGANTAAITAARADIGTNTATIAGHGEKLGRLDADVGANRNAIAANTNGIKVNSNLIDGNSKMIKTNTEGVAANKRDIGTSKTNIASNTASMSNWGTSSRPPSARL